MSDGFGALIYIAIFGGVCATILKVRDHNPWWGLPLGIMGPLGIVVAIGIGLIPKRRENEDDGPGGFSR